MRADRRSVARRLHEQDGVSIVEVLVVILLLSGAFLAMVQVSTTGLFSLRSTADRTTAIGLATQAVEAGRQLPWANLALDDTSSLDALYCGTLVEVDRPGGDTEAVVCSIVGGVSDELPFWGQDGLYDIQTYVTTIDGYANARRVTSIVQWNDRGQTMEVRTSNVVAAVERG